MRSALPVLALLGVIAVVVAWALLANDRDALPPSAGGDGQARTGEASTEVPTERSNAAPPRPRPNPTTEPSHPANAAPPTPRQDAAPANVVLRVREAVEHRAVASFTWRYANNGTVAKGEAAEGEAMLRLPAGTRGQLLVEAGGMTPSVIEIGVPPAGAPAATIDVIMNPAAVATGITLLVHDLSLTPIASVRVDAFVLSPEARGTETWALGTPLWARRTSAADGRYELPELAPGEYGIRVVAVATDGSLLPMLPFKRRFELTGSNGFLEDVPLEPGCVPTFELVDGNGAALDPAQVGVVRLGIRLVGGPPVARRWVVQGAGAAAASGIDVLPGIGTVSLAEALPAGSYEFEAAIGGHAPVRRVLALQPGATTNERVVVP